eukprot:CAMPEP_0172597262 /NCGR_PEP_ID=MMETSP1068-20121228/17236_1 /TAXON_ID=35684 /ORGANISM="Pseudopedinella elastica, Strain CCMP716" /LENGTH=127 /DNA_ID=CAMNT_0013396709 /DNA_START=586 /DNA_END=968 /DNA_ORIENTATION=+
MRHCPPLLEEDPAPRIVARVLTCASVDIQAPVRPDLIEDGPVKLLNLVSEGARAGVEDSFGGRRGEESSGDSAVAARWSLPHSDWSASAMRLPGAYKAPHLVAAFSALKEPAPKNESSEGHRPRVCS